MANYILEPDYSIYITLYHPFIIIIIKRFYILKIKQSRFKIYNYLLALMYPGNFGYGGYPNPNMGYGMGTNLEFQGANNVYQGQMERNIGANQMYQGNMERNVGYYQEQRGMQEMAQGNFIQGMYDLQMGQRQVQQGNFDMRMGQQQFQYGTNQANFGMNQMNMGAQMNNGFGFNPMGNGYNGYNGW